MKRTIGVAEIEGDSLHLAVFEINKSGISFVTEETLGPDESSKHLGLEVWLIIRSADRSVRYTNLPKNAKRQAREMAFMQISPSLLLDPEEYAYDALIKPVGERVGALVIAIPLSKAQAWEKRIEGAGLVLVSFAVEPLFYPLLRLGQPGKVLHRFPTPQGDQMVVGCINGTPVCWKRMPGDSSLPEEDAGDFLVQEFFCETPEPFVPEKVMDEKPVIEPRLVGYLGAAQLASLCPRPWEGCSVLAFAEFLKREQFASASWGAILKCAAMWAVVAVILIAAGIAHVRNVEERAAELALRADEMEGLADQSSHAAQEVGQLMELCNRMRELTVEKQMTIDLLRQLQDVLPYRVKISNIHFDLETGMQAEGVAENEPDILIFLGRLPKLPMIERYRLLFEEARDDGLFHFRFEVDIKKSGNSDAAQGNGLAFAGQGGTAHGYF